jgi:hypothetical protein
VQGGGVGEGRRDVQFRGVALVHAVGRDDHPVTGFDGELLQSAARPLLHPEGQVDGQFDLLDPAVAQPEGERVAGVDDLRRRAVQIDPQHLSGHVARCAGSPPAGSPAVPRTPHGPRRR